MCKLSILFTALLLLCSKSIQSSENQSDNIFPSDIEFGYVPIGEKGSKTWFWFAPSKNDPSKDPLVLWLDGGPGCSSTIGLFFLHGPFYIKVESDTKATARDRTWNEKANVLYVDQPLGVGFSVAAKGERPLGAEDVRANFLEFLSKWFNLPKYLSFKKRDMYIFGESYGGKWAPYISNIVYLSQNPDFNLKGVGLGNGFMTPLDIVPSYPDYANLHKDKTHLDQTRYEAAKQIAELCHFEGTRNNPMFIINRYDICFRINDIIVEDPETKKPRFVTQNVNREEEYSHIYPTFLNLKSTQEVLGLDMLFERCSNQVYEDFVEYDIFRDAGPFLRPMLDNPDFKVVWMNGNVDYVCNWMGEEIAINKLAWNGQDEWNKLKWKDCLYGKCKELVNKAFYRFDDAGHFVPKERLNDSIKMLNKFIGMD